MGALINSGIGAYEGTSRAVKTSFDLTHKDVLIFERYFNGQSVDIVQLEPQNRILIPNHNFVDGEEVIYDYDYDFLHSPIGIATTTVPGIGVTDILPNKLYVIKENESYIKFALTPEDAISEEPISISITSVGIGTLHKIYSTNTDSRVLVTIDNIIQSPIVGSGVTTALLSNVSSVTDIIQVESVNELFSGDLIKINDEIMTIRSVGYTTTTDILVRRPTMGSQLGFHSTGDILEKLSGNYTLTGNTINFASAPYGSIPIGLPTNPPDERDYSGITTSSKFSGRCFIRSTVPGSTKRAYHDNYIFDDISEGFTGLSSDFYLSVDNENVSDFELDSLMLLVRGIFQSPEVKTNVTNSGSYKVTAGINSVGLNFVGLTSFYENDALNSGVPIGGVISSVGSSEGFGYQPLKQASGGSIISIGGSIIGVAIRDGGYGYRNIQDQNINVYAKTGLLETEEKTLIGYGNIGTSIEEIGKIISVTITNPGSEYTITNPPEIIIDSPINYTNIPLIYSSSSQSGVGTGAKVDIVVGQGSSIIDFVIKDYGYGYKSGDILTIPIGSENDGVEELIEYVENIFSSSEILVGIVSTYDGPVAIENNVTLELDNSTIMTIGDNQYKSLVSEFQIFVESVYKDTFNAWSFGELEVLDSPERLFNGSRKTFPLTVDGLPKSIAGNPDIDLGAALLVFLNNILQVPGEGYIFDGGSTITFAEPPNGPIPGTENTGDNCQILFYKGTKDIDVVNIDIFDTIKPGDTVRLIDDDINKTEDERIVHSLDSTTSFITNIYNGVGIVTDITSKRPIQWCQQTEDLFIDGQEVTKDRFLYEPFVTPISNIIANVGTSKTTSIYIESGKTLFDNNREDTTKERFSPIEIFDQTPTSRAKATVSISNGSVSSINLVSGGIGYKNAPSISIQNPVGIGSTGKASAISYINTVGVVTGISIVNPGFGYTFVPEVIIEYPTNSYEKINNVSYVGDYGVITGIADTVVGVATTALIFTLYVPEDSTIRDNTTTGIAISSSQLKYGDYFAVRNTYVGNGIISVDVNGKEIGISTTYLDNVYQVYDVYYAYTQFSEPGITLSTGIEIYNSPLLIDDGVTTILDDDSLIIVDQFSRTDVVVRVAKTYPQIRNLPPSLTSYGDYSWCRLDVSKRLKPKAFMSYNQDGIVGITSSAIVRRSKPLNYLNYIP